MDKNAEVRVVGYTRQEIISKCKIALEDAKTFYQQDIVNYRGRTEDTNELYSEVVAEYLCENIFEFMNGIPEIIRSEYKIDSHDGKYDESSNRLEEKIAMKMFVMSENGREFQYIGKIIDYQTPLKAKRDDVAGKIDLLSYNSTSNMVYILELKEPDSMETMLRCVLEGYTYFRTVNMKKLFDDFLIPRTARLVASPFVFKGSIQEKEIMERRPFLKKLMELLESKPFFITDNYNVEEA